VLGFKPSGFKIACTRVHSRFSRSCDARGTHGKRRYSLRESIWYERWKSGKLFFRYAARGRSGRVLIRKGTA
jgi:hypothetical protein